MCAIEPGPTNLQTVVAVATELRRALARVEQVNEVATWIECDHHRDPAESSAMAVVTSQGRVAELWRYLRGELAGAEYELDEVLEELDDLGDTIGGEVVP
jgi:hypothetical protein